MSRSLPSKGLTRRSDRRVPFTIAVRSLSDARDMDPCKSLCFISAAFTNRQALLSKSVETRDAEWCLQLSEPEGAQTAVGGHVVPRCKAQIPPICFLSPRSSGI